MSRPASSTFDALQAHFKAGLSQPPSFQPSQIQQSKDCENAQQTTSFGPGQSQLLRPSPASSYLDPAILADDEYHGRFPSNQPAGVAMDDALIRATTSRNNLVPILPKPSSTGDKSQRLFPAAAWDNQINIVQKRKAEDEFIDPRLSKAPRHDGIGFPSMGATEQQSQHEPSADITNSSGLISTAPKYTYPAPSSASAAAHDSHSPQGSSPSRFDYRLASRPLDAMGMHRTISTLGMAADNNPIDSATDALLERQLNLRDESEEESESENRRKGLLRYDDENDDEPQRGRRGRGRGRAGRGRGARRGPRKAAEPTGDVKYRIHMASSAYMDGRLDEAIEWAEDAIRINAETYRAWSLLTSLLEEKGDLKASFTARVFSCHLQPKHVSGWLHCAEIGIALRDELPQDADEFLEQVSVCYSAALRADINNRQARHGRAAIAVERGQIRTAAKDYLYLLEHGEYDVHALRSYAEMTILLASTGKRSFYKPDSAIGWYHRAFNHFRECGMDDRYPIEWQDINIFAGLLAYVEHTKDALYELKTLARWLLGRSDESFWDDWQDDDREWDVDGARRVGFQDFQEGRYPESSYGSGLPLDLRTKLAVYRLKLGDIHEAQVSQRVRIQRFRRLTSVSIISTILTPRAVMGHRCY